MPLAITQEDFLVISFSFLFFAWPFLLSAGNLYHFKTWSMTMCLQCSENKQQFFSYYLQFENGMWTSSKLTSWIDHNTQKYILHRTTDLGRVVLCQANYFFSRIWSTLPLCHFALLVLTLLFFDLHAFVNESRIICLQSKLHLTLMVRMYSLRLACLWLSIIVY